MDVISEKTNVPLFAVLVSLPFIIGTILWLTAIASDANAANERTSMMQQRQARNEDILIDIRERLIRIEEKIKSK